MLRTSVHTSITYTVMSLVRLAGINITSRVIVQVPSGINIGTNGQSIITILVMEFTQLSALGSPS
jgi:hypothetical protein